MKELWNNFWWKYYSLGPIIFGGRSNTYKRFRWQRLFNMIIVLIIIYFLVR